MNGTLSSLSPVSATSPAIAEATAFAVRPPRRSNTEKSVLKETLDLESMIRDPEKVLATASRLSSYRQRLPKEDSDKNRRAVASSNERLEDEPQSTFDSYA